MLTINNEPYTSLTLRINGYAKLIRLKYAWRDAGNPDISYKDLKTMFDNDVFGALSIRVLVSDSVRNDGMRIVRYERYVKVQEGVSHLRKLLTL